jgi:hypothetical protein
LLRFVWWWLWAREPDLSIFTRTWANLSRRFGVLIALGIATVLGLSLVFEWFI